MFETIVPILWEILGVIGAVILTIIGIIGISALKNYLSKLNISIDDSSYNEIILIITNIVKALYQKYTKTIKDNSKDGKLTEYQSSLIKEKAVNIVKRMLSSDQIEYLLNKYNILNIDDALDIVIESVLLDVKNELKDDLVIKTGDLETLNEDNENTEPISSISYTEPNEKELESLNLCLANCSVCPLNNYCDICRVEE